MGKLLKADLYRLFKTKSYYILNITILGLILLNLIIAKRQDIVDETDLLSEFTGIEVSAGVVTGGNVAIYMSIFVAIFVAHEFTHGTMKNVVSKGYSRIKIYLSKLIAVSVATTLMFLAILIFTTIVGTVVTGEFGEITGTYALEFLRMLAIVTLLYLAFSSLYLMIVMIVRSSGGAIAINLIGVTMFGPEIYELFNWLFKNKYDFNKYSLTNNVLLYNESLSPPLEDIGRSIIVGLVFLVVTTLIGSLVFEKTDIK